MIIVFSYKLVKFFTFYLNLIVICKKIYEIKISFRLRQVLAGSLHRPPPHSSITQQQQLAAHQHLHTHNSLHKQQLIAAALIRAAIKSLQSLFMMLMEMQVMIKVRFKSRNQIYYFLQYAWAKYIFL